MLASYVNHKATRKMRKPSKVRKLIDDNQKSVNERFDILRKILDTLNRYGVKDEDFQGYPTYRSEPEVYYIASQLEQAKQEKIDEAIDLCEVLNSSQQPKRWIFRRKPSDTTTQALVNQLKRCYFSIVG